jgi:tripartite-type tricarboxylate transporter receptor subunit TctC
MGRLLLRHEAAWAMAACAIAPLTSVQVHAQSYPSKPIRLIVPYAPGGTSEVLARMIAQRMGDQLGQMIIVDTRAGASGSLGAGIVAAAQPDGYTILFTSLSPVVINVNLRSLKVTYDPQKDFAPISIITKVPSVFTVSGDSALRSIKDLIAAAKASPGKLSYGSSGIGSVNHLIGEMFKLGAGVDMLHVPYKGAGQGMIGLMTKEVTMILAAPPAILPQVRNNQLRALAVSGANRSPALPNVPTVIESGIPGFDMSAWYCLLAPGGTPRPVIEKIRDALIKTITTPPVSERLIAEGAAPEPSTPEEFAQLIASDLKVWAKAVQISGADK